MMTRTGPVRPETRRLPSGTSLMALAIALAGTATTQAAAVPESEPSAGPSSGVATADAPQASSTDKTSSPDKETSEGLQEVVVTGSHITRDGSTAPTPVTVLGSDYVDQRAETNIADALNELPAFRADNSPQQSASFLAGAGENFADLRSLGSNRTLTLIDGQRWVPSATTGEVDLNLIPSILVDRVEVVTGGASASYGSDAVAGVVNLVLKNNFKGIQGDVQYGRSQYGDDVDYRVAVLAGTSLLDDRLHFTVAGEYEDNGGAGDMYTRPWGAREYGIVSNPSPGNGYPLNVISDNVHNSTMAPGGLITSGPLQGTTFLPNGTPVAFQYGKLVGSSNMIGGDGTSFFQGFALLPQISRRLVYGRTNFDVTDHLNVFLDLSYSDSDAVAQSAIPFDFGDLTINSNNAFLPASIKQAMAADNVNSFSFGRFNTDFGPGHNYNKNQVKRAVFGIKGDIGEKWKYDVSNEYGQYTLKYDFINSEQPAKFAQAVDAVVNPANGQIVCQSTLTHPNNGCVPFNPFGSGRNDPSTYGYFLGDQWTRETIDQEVASANIQGPLFSLPGGDLKVATGIQFRRESAEQTVDPSSLLGLWEYGNSQPISGSYTVKEAYGEFDAPVLKDLPLVSALSLSGAARYTDYSTSGNVVTWKAGVDWTLTDQVRFRATRSRDIRAPNISELFTPSNTLPLSITDPVNNTQYFTTVYTAGNQKLQPERANSFTGGMVLTPFHNFTLTADYFSTNIVGAIESLAGQEIIDRCFGGDTALCSEVTRNSSGAITSVNTSLINIASVKERGLDLEANYRLPLSAISTLPGTMLFRALATRTFQYTSSDGQVSQNLLGETSSISRIYPMIPLWVANANIGYNLGGLSTLVTGRFISGGKYQNSFITGVDINDNNTPSRLYIDISGGYKIVDKSTENLEVYLDINNLFNTDPPVVPDASRGVTNYTYYDVIGRVYKVGVRFKF